MASARTIPRGIRILIIAIAGAVLLFLGYTVGLPWVSDALLPNRAEETARPIVAAYGELGSEVICRSEHPDIFESATGSEFRIALVAFAGRTAVEVAVHQAALAGFTIGEGEMTNTGVTELTGSNDGATIRVVVNTGSDGSVRCADDSERPVAIQPSTATVEIIVTRP